MRDLDSQDSCKSADEPSAQTNGNEYCDVCYDSGMAEPNDNQLINFIAATVETMRDQMATKDDLVKMATNIESLRDQMATKDDLVKMATNIESLRDQMATKDDLAALRQEMATKDDLAVLRAEMATKEQLSRLATTVRGDFEQVHFRFDTLERAMSTRLGQVETDISRLRSVLYLLVKDKPDMLRLLGQPTGKSRP